RALLDVLALEVGAATAEVNEAAGHEPAVLEEHEPDAPVALRDRLPAAPALRLAARRALGAVDARQAWPRGSVLRDALERRALGLRRVAERLEDRLGALVR